MAERLTVRMASVCEKAIGDQKELSYNINSKAILFMGGWQHSAMHERDDVYWQAASWIKSFGGPPNFQVVS